MRLSQGFLYTYRDAPKDAVTASHKLMLRANMVAQTAAGIYCWLPLGLRVLNKISDLIRDELDKAGLIEILMSTIQQSELWVESGRYDAYGDELLRFKDRKDRELLYGPTNEEQVTDIFRRFVKSYKDLPMTLYQLQWKFRDEMRPRFGVMRGREFLMKDAYSFDLSKEDAVHTYNKIFQVYMKIFKRIGLVPIAVAADSGAIGGDMSHEFHVLAPVGESKLFYDKRITECGSAMDFYAVSEEKYDPSTCSVASENLCESMGIEVGHIFYFGDKYTKSMNVTVSGSSKEPITPVMGSYGIGVSRLVGAVIEVFNDKDGIIWPEQIAPYSVAIVNLSGKDEKSSALSGKIYQHLLQCGVDVVLDDRDISSGVKLKDIDLIGIPNQVIVSEKGIANGHVEFKKRATGHVVNKNINEIIDFLCSMFSGKNNV